MLPAASVSKRWDYFIQGSFWEINPHKYLIVLTFRTHLDRV